VFQKRGVFVPAAAAILGAAVAAAVVWNLVPEPPPGRVQRYSIVLPTGQELSGLDRTAIAISPDGTNLAYNANGQLYLRPLDELEARSLDGTRGATNVFFSPDGKWIGFVASGILQKLAVGGGSPFVLCDASDNVVGASWGDDGTILLADILRGVYRVSAAGGEPRQIAAADPGRFSNGPLMLPGSRAFLYTMGGFDYDVDSQTFVQSFDTGEKRLLFEGGTDVRYLSTGHLVYLRRGVLLAAPFDIDRLEVVGTPVAVAQGVLHDPMGAGAAQFGVSNDGTLVTLSGPLQQRRLVWMDRRGTVEPLPLSEATYVAPALSPSGEKIAMMIRDQSGIDIWVYDLDREALTKLTFSGDNGFPIWSPDGERVVFGRFGSHADQPYGIFSVPADGHAPPEPLTSGEFLQFPTSYSPDSVVLAFNQPSSTTGDVYVLRTGKSSPEPLLATPFVEGGVRFSPDGRWIAYFSNESGRGEVYVRSFPEGSSRQQISTSGGDLPTWNLQGGELFYKEGNRMMVVAVETGATFRAGKPSPLFETPGEVFSGLGSYDVSPDGQRFLLTAPGQNARKTERIDVVVNWFVELKRKFPAK
jgi:serine/threonine-protein kinase